MEEYINAAEQVSLFCRININIKHDLPVRSSEMGFLIYVCRTDGEKTPTGAARFFKVSKANITNMVTSLVRKGYLRKGESGADKRSILLLPTSKAEELVEAAYTEYFKTMQVLERNMGAEEFAGFISLLETANKILLEEKENG